MRTPAHTNRYYCVLIQYILTIKNWNNKGKNITKQVITVSLKKEKE